MSINGICSTVAKKSARDFEVTYIPETLRKTTAKDFVIGSVINLEKSLCVGDTLDAHFVTGHIDTVGMIQNIKNEGKSKIFSITLPKEFLDYIVYKGSITIDGVGLTVSLKTSKGFEVSLIPYTLSNTNLDKRKVGDRVNIETDMIGKYVLNYAKKTKNRK